MEEGEERAALSLSLLSHQRKADDHVKEAARMEQILEADREADREEEEVEKRRISIEAMEDGQEKEDALNVLEVATIDATDRRSEEVRLEELAKREIDVDREAEAADNANIEFNNSKSGMSEEEKAIHAGELKAAHEKVFDHQRELETLEETAKLERERNAEKESLAHRKLAISKMKNNQEKKEALRQQEAMENKLADLEKELQRQESLAKAEKESNRLAEEAESERVRLLSTQDEEEKESLRQQIAVHERAADDHARELVMAREVAEKEKAADRLKEEVEREAIAVARLEENVNAEKAAISTMDAGAEKDALEAKLVQDEEAGMLAKSRLAADQHKSTDRIQEVERSDEILIMEKEANREEEGVAEESLVIATMAEGEEKQTAIERLHADEHRAADRRKEEARLTGVAAAERDAHVEEEAIDEERIDVDAMVEGDEKENALKRLQADEKHAHDLSHEADRLEELAILEREADNAAEYVDEETISVNHMDEGDAKDVANTRLEADQHKALHLEREVSGLEDVLEAEKASDKESYSIDLENIDVESMPEGPEKCRARKTLAEHEATHKHHADDAARLLAENEAARSHHRVAEAEEASVVDLSAHELTSNRMNQAFEAGYASLGENHPHQEAAWENPVATATAHHSKHHERIKRAEREAYLAHAIAAGHTGHAALSELPADDPAREAAELEVVDDVRRSHAAYHKASSLPEGPLKAEATRYIGASAPHAAWRTLQGMPDVPEKMAAWREVGVSLNDESVVSHLRQLSPGPVEDSAWERTVSEAQQVCACFVLGGMQEGSESQEAWADMGFTKEEARQTMDSFQRHTKVTSSQVDAACSTAVANIPTSGQHSLDAGHDSATKHALSRHFLLSASDFGGSASWLSMEYLVLAKEAGTSGGYALMEAMGEGTEEKAMARSAVIAAAMEAHRSYHEALSMQDGLGKQRAMRRVAARSVQDCHYQAIKALPECSPEHGTAWLAVAEDVSGESHATVTGMPAGRERNTATKVLIRETKHIALRVMEGLEMPPHTHDPDAFGVPMHQYSLIPPRYAAGGRDMEVHGMGQEGSLLHEYLSPDPTTQAKAALSGSFNPNGLDQHNPSGAFTRITQPIPIPPSREELLPFRDVEQASEPSMALAKLRSILPVGHNTPRQGFSTVSKKGLKLDGLKAIKAQIALSGKPTAGQKGAQSSPSPYGLPPSRGHRMGLGFSMGMDAEASHRPAQGGHSPPDPRIPEFRSTGMGGRSLSPPPDPGRGSPDTAAREGRLKLLQTLHSRVVEANLEHGNMSADRAAQVIAEPRQSLTLTPP